LVARTQYFVVEVMAAVVMGEPLAAEAEMSLPPCVVPTIAETAPV